MVSAVRPLSMRKGVLAALSASLATLSLCIAWPLRPKGVAEAGPHPEIHSSQDNDFSKPGMYSSFVWKGRFPVPPETHGLEGDSLVVSVRVPRPRLEANPGAQSPYPVIVFYSGFQARAAWYTRIVVHLASWGFAVVQYDTPILKLTPVAAEVAIFPRLLDWLERQTTTDQESPLYGQLNMSCLATAGHSRGGKLAAIVYALNPRDRVAATWLIDPIDASNYAPESPDNPSAIRELQLSKYDTALGLTGAGVLSRCNPVEGNYAMFLSQAAGPGSWSAFLPGASHSAFSDAGLIVNAIQDALCSRGRAGRGLVAELTVTPMLAWFYKQLKVPPIHGDKDPLETFEKWLLARSAQGCISLEEKGLPDSGQELTRGVNKTTHVHA